jgi:predicted kinase
VCSQPLTILISGLPGTGKSTLATCLGQRIGAVAMSRDQARQEVSGPLRLLDRGFIRLFGAYRRGLQEQANRRLEKAVADELVAGRPVVVEVVADRVLRRQLERLAAEHGTSIRSIEVTCSDATELARRLRSRRATGIRSLPTCRRPTSHPPLHLSSTPAPPLARCSTKQCSSSAGTVEPSPCANNETCAAAQPTPRVTASDRSRRPARRNRRKAGRPGRR